MPQHRKLSHEQVRLLREGKITAREASKEWTVSTGTINKAIRGLTYKDVDTPATRP